MDRLAEQGLLSRGDLERSIADYDARDLELRQRVGAQLQVAMGPGYTYDHGVRKVSFGLSFALPIFNQDQGPIGEAVAAREEAGRKAESVQLTALNDIAAARASYRLAVQTVESARDERQASETLQAEAASRLRTGDADRPSVLSSEVIVLTARVAELDAGWRAQQALGVLEDSLRRPLAGPELRLAPEARP